MAGRDAGPAGSLGGARQVRYILNVTSPLHPDEIRAAAQTHRDLGPDYDKAVVDSFLERINREVDARVDARIAAHNGSPPVPQARSPRYSVGVPIGSIVLGIPLTAIVMATGNSAGSDRLAGLFVIWLAIAIINVAYALRSRPPRPGR